MNRGQPTGFLGLYALFFVFNGLYHLAFGTVQGKLIRPWRRGRLLLISTFYGALPAMLMAWWLLPGWLSTPEVGFGLIFGFAAACMALSGLVILMLFEPRLEQHPRYLATVNLCLAVPFVFAPLVGLLVDMESIGFRLVFAATAVFVIVGALMTLTLQEPRSHWVDAETHALGASGDE